MKPEIKDIVIEAAKAAPAAGATVLSSPWWVSINWTGVLTGVFIVLQIVYLLRKWWREETSFGIWMRRKVGAPVISKPMELDE
ncbi:hypothetical protein [Roseateles chitosanitabidus]|uniref:hypothetical protein n=1 Tax=Roseateles chitosanitabidus TaxID=65048 RepID=UPI000831E057|nr:hypothetical protein [Roseateles chitosanitabidus]